MGLAIQFIFIGLARACEPLVPKALPVYGSAKDGTADYKLINQSMRDLLESVRSGHPTPAGFSASTTRADWQGSPIKHGVLVEGHAPAGHALGPGPLRITIQRYPSGCVVHLVGTAGEWERYVPPGEFGRIFPWTGPTELLLSLVRGVLENPTLAGWSPFDPGDPLGTRTTP